MGQTCTNCGHTLTGKYCSSCGQKAFRLDDWSLKRLVVGVFKDFSHFDFKLFKDIPKLVFNPGYLTNEFVEGRINSHIKPITMFVWLNILFFIGGYRYVLPQNKLSAADYYVAGLEERVLAKASLMQLSEAAGTLRFNTLLEGAQKSLFFWLIPVFAMLTMVFFLFQKRNYYVKHFVYSVHFWSYFFLFFTVVPILLEIVGIGWRWLTGAPLFSTVDGWVFLTLFALCVYPYTLLAIKKVFAIRWFAAISLAFLISIGVHFLREWAIAFTYYLAYWRM
ncbi:DUF3667 domain-containing protein [Parapedobacter sp. 2B3]|uniref:DUF3667 domain-containing protein n=1 Tax=Parapedobacter sp. 2B3 TaxID=3342381 RepID=UPI0035B5E87B